MERKISVSVVEEEYLHCEWVRVLLFFLALHSMFLLGMMCITEYHADGNSVKRVWSVTILILAI